MTKHTRTKVPAGTTHIINASTGEVKELKNNHIQKMALDNGFKLKEQPNGKMELNPYVYDFANALTDELKRENEELLRQLKIRDELSCSTCHGSGNVLIAIDDGIDCPACAEIDNEIKADAVRDYEASLSSFAWTAEQYIEEILRNK
tara:strand:- start:4783 stop:5223 length:441 start_codon:yes stop_codon:yes gene_type:complete